MSESTATPLISSPVQTSPPPELPGLALLLDVLKAAAMLGVSRSKFWQLHSQGRVPLPVRLSARVVRWRKHELEAWVRCGCPARHRWDGRTLTTTS